MSSSASSSSSSSSSILSNFKQLLASSFLTGDNCICRYLTSIFRNNLMMQQQPWYYTLGYILAFYTAIAIIGFICRFVFKYGQIIKQRVGRIANPKFSLDMFTVSGDFLAEIIHEEMYGEEGHAYLKHGIALPTKFIGEKAPALVVDVGANVGLFGMSMKTFSEEALKNYPDCRIPSAKAMKNALTAAAGSSSPSSALSHTSNNNKKGASASASASPRSVSKDRRSASASRKSSNTAARTSSANARKSVTTAVASTKNIENYSGPLLPAVRIIGFEPIPETYQCCDKNWNMVFGESNREFPQHASRAYPFGIGDKNCEATFFYDATISAAASMTMAENGKPFSNRIIEALGAWLRDTGRYQLKRIRTFVDLLAAPLSALRLGYGHLLGVQFFPVRLFFFILAIPALLAMVVYRLTALPPSKQVTCQILTLPEALRRAGADDPSQSIAFLKIDVEGAEEQVCNGIDDVTWARVHQTVVEVHDTPDGRVKRIKSLLKKQGFKSIVVDEEPLELHRMGNIYTIFATRG